MSLTIHKRLGYLLMVSALIGLCSAQATAATVAEITLDPLQLNYCGDLVNVGSITATLSDGRNEFANDNQITASATINAPYNECNTFHWLQVITSADPGPYDPLEYEGAPLDSNAAINALPIIDVPNPNYDGRAADDDLPWYLTAAEEGGSNPNIGGNVTNGDGSITYTMIDQPRYGGFTFHTYLVAEDCDDPNQINVLAAFWWGYGNQGGASSLVPGPMDNWTVDQNAIDEINEALNGSGFGDYTAVASNTLCCCVPEPSTIMLAVLGAVAVVPYAVRRKARA